MGGCFGSRAAQRKAEGTLSSAGAPRCQLVALVSGSEFLLVPDWRLHGPAGRSPSGVVMDISPPMDSGINVRTRVHEYGGGELVVQSSDLILFANFK
jgi:hypothetical protein